MTDTIPYMVRCRCGAVARVEVPAERVTKTVYSRGIVGVPGSAVARQVTVLEERFGSDSFILATMRDCGDTHPGRCWTCGKRLKIDRLEGHYSPEHECNGKCMASKGPTCECSCGGKNHGRSWA